jgi:hypothetical protein
VCHPTCPPWHIVQCPPFHEAVRPAKPDGTLWRTARSSVFADSASPMSSLSPSASPAPSVVRTRSRCRSPGGPTSTSSIARSLPRVGRLPRCPSYPPAAVAVDATIVVARREGRNRRAWLSTRRRFRAARATNCPAATRSARPISIPSATGTPCIPPSPHRRRSPSDPPPPIAAATSSTAQ